MFKEWSNWGKRHETPPKSPPSAVPSSVNGDAEESPKEKSHIKTGSEATLLQNSAANGSTMNGSEEGNSASDKKKSKNHQPAHEPFTEEEIEQMIELLEETTGHLGRLFASYTLEELNSNVYRMTVLFSTRFLEGESMGQNFLWSKDRIPPIGMFRWTPCTSDADKSLAIYN